MERIRELIVFVVLLVSFIFSLGLWWVEHSPVNLLLSLWLGYLLGISLARVQEVWNG